MKDSPTKAALKRALSRLEQSPAKLQELKALEAVLRELAQTRARRAGPATLLGSVKALSLGTVGVGRSLLSMSSQTWVDLAVELTNKRLHAPALLACDAALYVDRGCAEAWFNKAVVLTRQKRYEQALAAYREAGRLKPDHPEIPFNEGGILSRLGRYPQALAAYEEAVRRSGLLPLTPALGGGLLEGAERRRPECAEAWFNKGVVLARLGRFDEAVAAYTEALRLRPGFLLADANRARLLRSLRGAKMPIRAVRAVPDSA